jgi:excisionase family DNA binding protein
LDSIGGKKALTREQPDEYYLTVAEVAEMLRLNQQTVRNWIDQGSLPAVRVGRRVRIKRSDLDRIVSEGYSGRGQGQGAGAGPSADDFWGGEPVGVAEPGAAATQTPSAETDS